MAPPAAGPLAGRTVLVTRERRQASGITSVLSELGAEVVEVPLISFEPPADPAPAGDGARRLAEFDMLLFTSANAVRSFLAIAAAAGHPVRPRAGLAVVAIGPATAVAAEEAGLTCEPLPESFATAGLAGWLANRPAFRNVLFPRAAVAGETLVEQLTSRGAAVEVVAVYRTVPHPDGARGLQAAVAAGVDYVTFTSPSTVRAFAEAMGEGLRPAGLKVACIGPSTAAAAEEHGLQPDLVADPHTAAGLAEAIARHAAGDSR